MLLSALKCSTLLATLTLALAHFEVDLMNATATPPENEPSMYCNRVHFNEIFAGASRDLWREYDFVVRIFGCVYPQYDFDRVVSLSLDDAIILGGILHSGFLIGWDRLRRVALRNLQIRHIDGNAFDRLPGIWHLNISYNRITNLQKDTFEHVKLQSLDLASNRISQIDNETFGADLERLILSNNKLKNYNSFWFEKNSKLKHIDMSLNSIDVLEPFAFANFHNLEDVHLESNFLFQIDDDTFANPHIRHIYLANNFICHVKVDAIKKIARDLQILDLSNNRKRLEEAVLPRKAIRPFSTIYGLGEKFLSITNGIMF